MPIFGERGGWGGERKEGVREKGRKEGVKEKEKGVKGRFKSHRNTNQTKTILMQRGH